VVFGVQKARKGNLFERISGRCFYAMFNRISEVKMPESHVTARLMSRTYLNALLSYKDKELFLGGVYELVGFQQLAVPVTKASHSKTTYTFTKKLTLIANAITSFSSAPLQIIFWTGLLISLFSLAFVLFTVYRWEVHSISPGFTSIIASIWLIGGINIFFLGVIGLYIKKILGEVVDRPYTTIRKIYE
jgi:putative glycosyltransferase